MEIDYDAEIDALAARRQTIWNEGGGEADEVATIGRQLTVLYEERRIAQAKLANAGRTRVDIQKSAKLEAELERLMSS